MDKKIRIVGIGIIILLVIVSSYLLLSKGKSFTNKNIEESENIITPKYDDESNNTELYIQDVLVEYENTPLYYDSYQKINENFIIYNVVYNDKITLDWVNIKDKKHQEITNMIVSNYSYKGIFRYNNNIISLYYIDPDICNKDGEVGKIFYVNTKNNEFVLQENVEILTKEIFNKNFSYYCDFYE